MSRDRRAPWGLLLGLAALALVIGGVALIVARSGGVPDGPVPITWNREPCAHCRMLVGEPAHAAQLVTRDGMVANFDDPGCLFRYLSEHTPDVHRLWFHHGADDRWLGVDEVGFATGAMTPMGFGLVAVDRTTTGALDLPAARAWIDAQAAGDARPAPTAARRGAP